jgi:hypothetical protein
MHSSNRSDLCRHEDENGALVVRCLAFDHGQDLFLARGRYPCFPNVPGWVMGIPESIQAIETD